MIWFITYVEVKWMTVRAQSQGWKSTYIHKVVYYWKVDSDKLKMYTMNSKSATQKNNENIQLIR